MDKALLALREGCYQKQLPQTTARELIRFLLVKKFMGPPEMSEGLSPSSKIDTLQHWILLNTAVRKLVEAVVGEISHSEKTAALPEEEKTERRLAAMNAISREGWTPKLDLWTEEGTLMNTIAAVSVRDSVENNVFSMFYVPESQLGPGTGQDVIVELLNNPCYKCSQDMAGLKKRKRKRPEESRGSTETSLGEKHLTIFRLQNGKQIRMLVSRRTIVQEVMAIIQDKTGIPADEYQLICDYGRLRTEYPLAEYLDWGSPSTTIDVLKHQQGC